MRYSIKQLEEAKKKLKTKLETLHDKPQDSTINFDSLGVDKLVVDEAHNYKNLMTVTKMGNVAGIATSSKTAKTMGFLEKCKYINEITGEKGLIFATGTPVSNSMTELFTFQRYLQPSRLKEAGIDFFTTGFELKPEGTEFQQKTRFSNFHNVPELMALFKEVADVKTADMLNLPVPNVEYVTEEFAPSPEQKEMVMNLAERADSIRSGGVDRKVDNMLKITTEGKKLALDQRLIDPTLPDDPNSKVNKCVDNVLRIYKETEEKKLTQLIFCDQSAPTGKGFNVYQDVKEKLIAQGVKPSEVAFIHDAKNEAQKAEMFAKVRSGQVRVLLGSTKMLGTGTNVQDKLIATHDLDVPYRPADLEQRAGRIVRQGNQNEDVKIFRYVTKGTFDAYLWQILENKQKFISQIMTSKAPLRSIQDVDEVTLSYAEVKALAMDNPLIKEKLENENNISRLKIAKSGYLESIEKLKWKIDHYPDKISKEEQEVKFLAEDAKTVAENVKKVKGKKVFEITLNGEVYNDRKEADEAITKAMKSGEAIHLKGEYRGMKLQMAHDPIYDVYSAVLLGKTSHKKKIYKSPMEAIDVMVRGFPKEVENMNATIEQDKNNFAVAKEEVVKPFAYEKELKQRIKRGVELDTLLDAVADEKIDPKETDKKRDKTSEPVAGQRKMRMAAAR